MTSNKYKFCASVSALIIFFATFLAYSNTFSVPFQFDDIACIANNWRILHLEKIGELFRYWPTRFITYLTFAINYKIHNFNVTGYHIVNLLIHIGCGLLIWRIAKKIFSGMFENNMTTVVALFSSLIFVLHPVQTQAVTYIYQRHTCLATLFVLSGFMCWIKVLERKENRWFWLIMCSIFAILGMFTKEIAIIFPFLILMYFFWFRNRLNCVIKTWKVIFYSAFLFSIIPATLLLAHGINISELQSVSSMQGPPGEIITRKDYFLTQGQAFLIYFKLIFLPLKQNLDYDISISKSFFSPPETLVGFTLMLAVTLFCLLLFKKNKILSFSLAIYIISILPQSSLIPKPDLVVEHRLYLPLTGFALFLPSFLYYIARKTSVVTVFLIVLLCFYGIATYQRNNTWKDALTLWNDTVSKSPNKARPYLNRGLAYAEKSDIQNALRDYTMAIKINPWYVEAYNNRGILFASIKNYQQALSDFNKAIELKVDYATAYNNRAVLYSSLNKWDTAIKDFDTALKLNPMYVDALKNRGIAFLVNKNIERAIQDFSTAIKIYPENGQLYFYRAVALLNRGDKKSATKDIMYAMKLGYPVPQALKKILNEQ
ncbi:MAG TPA: tetratricopeptide repeat protein [bacterium]|nr:tetratricopeptide repeat protein [bacterium]HOL34344.1 tetratricopeptide repeat protein [bacterium]HPP07994.1 tetratricopeptide repeat protein [bacterium]